MKTATQERMEAADTYYAYNRLADHPEAQADTIACHYTSLATTALKLRELVRLRRDAGVTSHDIDEVIQATVDIIKEEHRKAFGIKLEWPTKPY